MINIIIILLVNYKKNNCFVAQLFLFETQHLHLKPEHIRTYVFITLFLPIIGLFYSCKVKKLTVPDCLGYSFYLIHFCVTSFAHQFRQRGPYIYSETQEKVGVRFLWTNNHNIVQFYERKKQEYKRIMTQEECGSDCQENDEVLKQNMQHLLIFVHNFGSSAAHKLKNKL